MYGVLSLRSHQVPSVGALYRFVARVAAQNGGRSVLTLGAIGAPARS